MVLISHQVSKLVQERELRRSRMTNNDDVGVCQRDTKESPRKRLSRHERRVNVFAMRNTIDPVLSLL